MFGGERSGPVGKDGPDCCGTEPFAVQVKHGKQIPKKIQKYMEQTVGDCPEGLIPTLVMHPYGRSIDDSLVVIPLKDFKEWYLG
jgi:hypothetical protein